MPTLILTLLLFTSSAYGSLTVRSLLDTREHCLNEFNFPDPYSKVRLPALTLSLFFWLVLPGWFVCC